MNTGTRSNTTESHEAGAKSLAPADMFRLDGKVAVVTGASSGLGARFARVLRLAGSEVVLAARRGQAINELADEIGGKALVTDVTKAEDRSALMDSVVSSFGRLDILVNNAGIVSIEPAETESVESFRNVAEVNLVAPFALAQLAARVMLPRESGSIINVASVLGIVGVGQMPQASYTASKGGLLNLTRELAAQWSRRGVRVNAIAPGWFATEMTEGFFADERAIGWLRRKVPMGRGGLISELDGILLFLASDASSYVTGQTIAIDGGFTAV